MVKESCKFCGVHFPQDFEKTLLPPCNFWGDRGLSNAPVEIKKKIWDWVFSCPADEIFITCNVSFVSEWFALPVPDSAKFENIVQNWNSLSEKERQDFQRSWFRGEVPYNGIPIIYGKKD